MAKFVKGQKGGPGRGKTKDSYTVENYVDDILQGIAPKEIPKRLVKQLARLLMSNKDNVALAGVKYLLKESGSIKPGQTLTPELLGVLHKYSQDQHDTIALIENRFSFSEIPNPKL